jgi:anti-sigma regulatory factor (Ser/Thr protein kinase)
MTAASATPAEEIPLLRIDLPVSPEAPSLARAAITGFSDGRDIEAMTLAMLTLLVSEIVTNAVVHPQVKPPAEIRLSAQLTHEAIRVQVTDRGTGFTPVPRDPARNDAGYGLYLVEQQASRWGVEQNDGTTVWFELPRRAPGGNQ